MKTIDTELIKRIVFAKYLFWQGNDSLKKSSILSDGLAILNYQDSAEMFLRTIAELLHASVKESSSFEQIIQSIENVSESIDKYKIPYRISLNQLNKARVNFKHFGLLPIKEDVNKFSRDLELLYRELVFKYFKMSFDDFSLVDIIKNYRIKNHLKEAEKFLNTNNFGDSIISSSKAFKLLFDYNRKLDLGIDSFSKFGDRNLNNTLIKIKDKLEDHEFHIDALKYGLNLAQYQLFKSISPIVHLSMAGTFHVTIWGSTEKEYTFENAQFCLKFVTESTLIIQNTPTVEKPFIGKQRKFEVINDSKIIVYPKSEVFEIIRIAKKGESLYGYYQNNDTDEYYAIFQDNDHAFIFKNDVKLIE